MIWASKGGKYGFAKASFGKDKNILKLLEEHGDDENGDDRRQGDADSSHYAAPYTLHLVDDMARHINGEDARGSLSHHHDVHKSHCSLLS